MAAGWSPSPVAAARRGARRTGAQARPPARPRVPGRRCARSRRTAARSSRTARLLPQSALDIPPHGWVNLHFSVLPAWRGAAPVQHALWAGDEVTGATTFRIVKELDAGPTFGVMTERIRPTTPPATCSSRLAEGGAGLLVATLDGIADGSLEAREQPTDGVSLAPKITVEDARVDWTQPAVAVDRQVRACTPGPGAWTTYDGERVKLGPVTVADSEPLAPGVLEVSKTAVLVGTGTAPVAARRGQGVRAEGDGRRRLGPRGPRGLRRAASGTVTTARVGRSEHARPWERAPARPDGRRRDLPACPEVELGTSWGDVPTYKVPRGDKGRGFVLYRLPHKTAVDPETGEMYDDLLVIVTPTEAEKRALVEDEATPFFTIDHFNGSNAVLVQQSRLGRADPRRAGRDHHRRLGQPGAAAAGAGAPRRWLSGGQRRRTARTGPGRALDVLKAVRVDDAYANLVLPRPCAEHGLDGRDAAFATELVSGTIRLQGRTTRSSPPA